MHRDVDKIAFTGSTVTGRKIMKAAADSNLKKVSLELGGKSPHLIFESADLDQGAKCFLTPPHRTTHTDGSSAYLFVIAANWAALGILYNTGQDCTAGSRVYVQESVHDKFVEILVGKAKELHIGDGFDEKSGGGPVVCTHFTPSLSTRHLEGLWCYRCPIKPAIFRCMNSQDKQAYSLTFRRYRKFNTTRFGRTSKPEKIKVRSSPWVEKNVRVKGTMWMLPVRPPFHVLPVAHKFV
jgi:hypothetical protein